MGQATLTNNVNGACGKAISDFLEPVYPSHLSSTHNDWNRNNKLSGQSTLTDKVNGARDKNFFMVLYFSTERIVETNAKKWNSSWIAQ